MTGPLPDFDDWYRHEYSRVLAAVLVVCGTDRDCAQEATSDAFVKALERWKSISTMDSPTGWTIRVAVNNANRRLARSRRGRQLEREISSTPVPSDIDVDVWDALRSLPPRQRAALVLRYADDLSQAEVAASLGVAPGTAAAMLNHARKNMRLLLTGDDK